MPPTSAATCSVDGMQARWPHGYWVPDMSVQCFAGWHLKLSAGGYTHHSNLSTACANAYRQHSFTRVFTLKRQIRGFNTSALDCWCDNDWYAMVSAGLGTPLALLSCVGIPLLPCLLLLHQRGHLESPDVKRRLAFLYCSYRSVPAYLCLLCAVTCCIYCIISCC